MLSFIASSVTFVALGLGILWWITESSTKPRRNLLILTAWFCIAAAILKVTEFFVGYSGG